MARYTHKHCSIRCGALPRVLLALAMLSFGHAWAQPAAEPGEEDSAEEPIARLDAVDEILVRGQRTLGAIRAQMEQARERVYDAFNALNSSDEFNIYCRNEQRTGSRVPQRVCRPRYADTATSRGSRDFLEALFFECGGEIFGECSHNAVSRAQGAHAEVHHYDRLLAQEFERLTRESADFRRAIFEYQQLENEYETARGRGQPPVIRARIMRVR